MTRILAALYVCSMSVVFSICYMMIGWGLHPKSWVAIIGFGVFGHTLTLALSKHMDKTK